MTDKTFTVVGTSILKGECKVRHANDVLRAKVLHKNGHTDVVLVELAQPMSKIDAVLFIKDLPEFQSPEQRTTIDEYIAKNTPKSVAAEVAAPATAEVAEVQEQAEVPEASEEAALDDQPF